MVSEIYAYEFVSDIENILNIMKNPLNCLYDYFYHNSWQVQVEKESFFSILWIFPKTEYIYGSLDSEHCHITISKQMFIKNLCYLVLERFHRIKPIRKVDKVFS